MNEYFLEDILEEAYKLDFAEHENPPEHRFSLKHKIRMRKIFSLYKKNTKHYNTSLYTMSVKMSLKWALIVIILAALTVTAAAVTITFLRKEHEDNTQLFAANIEGAPIILEEIYYLSAVPNGYECTTDNISNVDHTQIYTFKDTDISFMFYQCVKSEYSKHYDNERSNLKETKLGSYPAILYIDDSEKDEIVSLIVWDNGDYIFELVGGFSEKDLRTLAESVKIIS